MEYKPTIGLEIHIELNTKSKMFCSCENNPEERRPNFNICPICTAQPGTLPVINQEAVRKTIRTGLALNCQISEYSEFDRKNYFYPDLPKGYQISQLYNPLCQSGSLNKIRIREIHLEEDTGRLIHEKDCSLVDFNRAGVPLMELVTEPDMHSAKEAREFAEELHLIMHYLDVSDADMEKGQMRVEVNISLNQKSKIKNQNLGTKVEIKNLNSFRSVERAVEYEIKRQTGLLDKGEKIVQETRGWLDEATASSRRVAGASELDEAVASSRRVAGARELEEATTSSRRVAGAREDDVRGITVSQREKESAHDYRYFPEPDLPPLHFTKKEGDEISSHLPPHSTSWNLSIEEIRAEIPELPRQRKERFVKDYKLDEKNIAVLVYNKSLGEYFETIAKDLSPDLVKLAADFLINTEAKKYNIPHSYFSQLLVLIRDGKISKSAAKEILPELTMKQPLEVVKSRGLEQVSDKGDLEKIIKEVILQNQKAVQDYNNGKANALQFLAGQVMAASRGKANPQIVRDILQKLLG